MTQPIRYTIDHVDAMIRATQGVKKGLRASGKLDEFNRPTTPAPPSAKPKVDPPTHKAWCVKCKGSKTIQTADIKDTPNGAGRAIGPCPDCGTSTHAFMSQVDTKRLRSQMQSASQGYAYPV